MSYNTLTYQVEDNVGVVTFNRPDAANAMTPECAAEVSAVALEIKVMRMCVLWC